MQVSSQPISHTQLKATIRSDPLLSRVLHFIRMGWPEFIPQVEAIEPFWRRRKKFLVEADCLLLGSRVVVPPKCQEEVLKELHMGHPGIARMKAQACKGVCVVVQY